MGKKGQTLIFEQVLLFGISVAIFLICFGVFNVYQNFFLSVGNTNQLDEVKEWITANILKVASKEDATSFLIVPIPRYVGDAVYQIELKNEGLEVKNLLTNAIKSSSLYTLNETFALSGKTTSIKGKITIKKEGKQIIVV